MAVEFNPLDDGFVADPYPTYAALRDDDPVCRAELLQGWVVTRYDDVVALLDDASVSSSISEATPNYLTEMEEAALAEQPRAARTLVLADEPDHGRLRSLMSAPFTFTNIRPLTDMISDRVHATLDRVMERSGPGARCEFDLVAEVAYPLPVEVICVMLGVPDEDHEEFRHWTQCAARTVDPVMSRAERDEVMAGLDAMYAYLETQVAEKKATPGDDLLSSMIQARDEHGEGFAHEDLMAQVLTLYVAGHEPTAALIGNGMLALMGHPDQLERIRSEPEVLRRGVHELLRYDGPNQFVRRILTRPTELSGVTLDAGSVIYASPASANRDPRRWGDDADQVVVDRADASQHLQLGAGVHRCLGTHLARLQAELAFSAIFERLDCLELAGTPEWNNRMFIRGLKSLPVKSAIQPRA